MKSTTNCTAKYSGSADRGNSTARANGLDLKSKCVKPQRRTWMNNLRIIDADGHVQEKDAPWEELLEAPFKKHAPRVVTDKSGRAELLLEGKIWAKPTGIGCGIGAAPSSRKPQKTTGMFDPVQRLADMDME